MLAITKLNQWVQVRATSETVALPQKGLSNMPEEQWSLLTIRPSANIETHHEGLPKDWQEDLSVCHAKLGK